MKKILICIVTAALICLAAAWAPSRANAAASAPKPALPVHLRVVRLTGGLPVAGARPAGKRAQAHAGRRSAARPASAITLDAGMQFTMAGVTCGVPSARGAVSLRLRTSLDGRLWSPWYEAPLELAGEAGGPARAFIEPCLLYTSDAADE